VTVNTYEVNGLFGWGRGRWKGYAGLGIGAVTLDPAASTAALPGTTTRFAANAAVGTKYFFTDNLAFRLDGRYRWKAAPSHVGTIICGEEGCQPFRSDIYSSAEVTGGVTWRFGGSAIDPSGLPGQERFGRAESSAS
jgi:opacity protein-like surface antigen